MSDLTHLDEQGRARMVDVGDKAVTTRRAVASCLIRMAPETVAAIRARQTPKGDPFEVARIAGILGAKQTATLIPLCHPLPISHADIDVELCEEGVRLTSTVSTQAVTGVEMEALTAVSIAALTIYDMCKAVEKGIVISEIRLESKTGGKSGDWQR